MVALAEQYVKSVKGGLEALLDVISPATSARAAAARDGNPKALRAAKAEETAVRSTLPPLQPMQRPADKCDGHWVCWHCAKAALYSVTQAEGVIQQTGRLPPSILANREPFRHGDWRQQPYVPRCAFLRCTACSAAMQSCRSRLAVQPCG